MKSPARNLTRTETLRGIQRHSILIPIELDRRQSMIAEAAYYFSEHRGFEPGHELDDWLAAESQIDAALALGETPRLDGPS